MDTIYYVDTRYSPIVLRAAFDSEHWRPRCQVAAQEASSTGINLPVPGRLFLGTNVGWLRMNECMNDDVMSPVMECGQAMLSLNDVKRLITQLDTLQGYAGPISCQSCRTEEPSSKASSIRRWKPTLMSSDVLVWGFDRLCMALLPGQWRFFSFIACWSSGVRSIGEAGQSQHPPHEAVELEIHLE